MSILMRPPQHLSWIKCTGGGWCSLLSVNLNDAHFDNLAGVYIIWHGGQNPWTVRVGQGTIRERLSAHRQDRDVLGYRNLGLNVTWASVSAPNRDGVERYLSEKLQPKVGDRFPEVLPVPVNLPWD
jgi:hypothetical protein